MRVLFAVLVLVACGVEPRGEGDEPDAGAVDAGAVDAGRRLAGYEERRVLARCEMFHRCHPDSSKIREDQAEEYGTSIGECAAIRTGHLLEAPYLQPQQDLFCIDSFDNRDLYLQQYDWCSGDIRTDRCLGAYLSSYCEWTLCPYRP